MLEDKLSQEAHDLTSSLLEKFCGVPSQVTEKHLMLYSFNFLFNNDILLSAKRIIKES